MHEGIEPLVYNPGIFDKYKENNNLDSWEDFPDLMWGLGFEMDCEESFHEYERNCGLKLKEPTNEREEKRNRLYVLEHADRQVVGNELFSYWRYLTHWSMGGYTDYDVDFLKRAIKILEEKYK
ncbi:hypothetical protein SAMN02910276_00644 [Butyrivibrio sp. Su6]|uniref:hypothetical protein n=1 Tax=Butyrivibrio sp. Su6 TaxID=1520810 RepID=UPI00089ED00E|nr:hypothetical protein [Butyrivibrio sp. Su6]SEF62053.1 hypothetical protein SAMN02910276_00644 [Butyrivibrio sp. Su6]